MPKSLRARLVLAAAGSILTAVALFGLATVLLVRHELRSSLDRALRDRAQTVAELAVSAPAVLTQPGALEAPVSGRQIAVEVLDAHGRILARSVTLGARLLPQGRLAQAALAGAQTGFEDIRLGGRAFRLFAAPIAQVGGPAAGGAVLVASDTTDIEDTIHHIALIVALTGAGLALLAALVAAALSGRALRPLQQLAGAAGEIERTADPSRRLPEPGSGDEISQLTGVLNRMLASLQRAQDSERRFLADASHELRTPITALLGNVEYAARHGADPEVLADLSGDAARLARLVDDLLVLERAGAPAREHTPLRLDDLARAEASNQDRVQLARLDPVRVSGDQDALRRLLRNLVDNALIHGPANGPVTISVLARDARALLTVRDAGPGPDPARREQLFERFWRGPDATHRPGSGLGLSIAKAIADQHDGRVTVDGSAFTVDLPAIPANAGFADSHPALSDS